MFADILFIVCVYSVGNLYFTFHMIDCNVSMCHVIR